MDSRLKYTLVLLVGTWLAAPLYSGCRINQIDLGAPWESRETPFFDDGVDLVEDPQSLSGEWGFRQQNWLDGRIQLADSIAIVDIQTIQTKVDATGRQFKSLHIVVAEQLYGKNPTKDVSLQSPETAPGYPLILRHERHLQGRFIAFVRWFRTGEDTAEAIGHHFHLSPASEALLAEVKPRIMHRIQEERKDARREDD